MKRLEYDMSRLEELGLTPHGNHMKVETNTKITTLSTHKVRIAQASELRIGLSSAGEHIAVVELTAEELNRALWLLDRSRTIPGIPDPTESRPESPEQPGGQETSRAGPLVGECRDPDCHMMRPHSHG